MAPPSGPDSPPSVAPTDLRQLADHSAVARTFDGGAGTIAALDTGPGAEGTALMVAGYTGSKEDFAPLLAPLAASGYRVVVMDQRGQFESPGPDDPARYTVTELAEDVVAVSRVLVEEAGGPVHLLGHSFGGLVTRGAVLTALELFRSFTLLGSGPAQLTGGRAELLDAMAPLLEAGGVQLVHETMEQLAMTDPTAQAVPAPTREFYARRFLANSGAGLRGMADAMLAEPDLVEELKATGLPVLVAHGEADDAWMPHVQADMAQRLGARYEVIEDSIHSPAVENPPRTVAILCDFWSSLPVGR